MSRAEVRDESGKLNNSTLSAYDFGETAAGIVGGAIGGALGSLAFPVVGGVGGALGGAFVAKYVWEKYVAPMLDWSEKNSPDFWDSLFVALGIPPFPDDLSWDSLVSKMRSLFDAALDTSSPLVLDLDGDGVETISRTAGIHFDLDANGMLETTGWVGRDDGLLVRDLDGNGRIDSGRELFGNHTRLKSGIDAANGFEALKELDGNADGVVDSKDSAYASLMVWRDRDGDAVVDQGELLSLAQAGIKNLKVGYTNGGGTDAQGNRHLQVGTFTSDGGASQALHDVWFSVDAARTVDKAPVAVSAELQALPDVPGMGNVRSLHQAMARDASGQLKALVQQWIGASAQDRPALLDRVIYAWAGVQNLDPRSRGPNTDARRLAAVEALMGQHFMQGSGYDGGAADYPGPNAAAAIQRVFAAFATQLRGTLQLQTDFGSILDAVGLTLDGSADAARLDVWPVRCVCCVSNGTPTRVLITICHVPDFGNSLLLFPCWGRSVSKSVLH